MWNDSTYVATLGAELDNEGTNRKKQWLKFDYNIRG